MLGGFGVVDPEVLCGGFEFAAADDLEGGPGVALESFFFEVRIGLAVFAEAQREGAVLVFEAGGGFVLEIALLIVSGSGGWGHWLCLFLACEMEKSRNRDVLAARLYWEEDTIRGLESELWFGDAIENGGD